MHSTHNMETNHGSNLQGMKHFLRECVRKELEERSARIASPERKSLRERVEEKLRKEGRKYEGRGLGLGKEGEEEGKSEYECESVQMEFDGDEVDTDEAEKKRESNEKEKEPSKRTREEEEETENRSKRKKTGCQGWHRC